MYKLYLLLDVHLKISIETFYAEKPFRAKCLHYFKLYLGFEPKTNEW